MMDVCLSPFERPINKIGEWYDHFHDHIYYPLWQRMVKWVIEHRFCPYVLDYVYGVVRLFCGLTLALPLIFILFLLISLITPRSAEELITITLGVTYGIGLFLVLFNLVFSPVVWLYLLDCLTLKRKVYRRAELGIVRIQITVVTFRGNGPLSYLSYFFNDHPVPCYFLYRPLKENHAPMSSADKKPPAFYRGGKDKMGSGYKSVRFIMTKKKSKQIDNLLRLVPSAEFEICYLPFSRILREIRPIEGYDYPEGVKELCEKISKMYP